MKGKHKVEFKEKEYSSSGVPRGTFEIDEGLLFYKH